MIKWIRLGVVAIGDLIILRHHALKVMNDDSVSITDRMAYYSHRFHRMCRNLLKSEIYVEGKENIPKGQTLIVCNHCSYMDPVYNMNDSERGLSFLSKKEIRDFPFIGDICASLKSTFIDREDLRSEIKAIANIVKTLQENPDSSIVAYPEGTRAHYPDYSLGEFHSGTFKIATKLNIPIVLLAMYNTGKVFDQHYHYHKYPIQMIYAKPIMPEEYKDMTTKEIADLAHQRIEEALEIEKSRDRDLVKKLNKYSERKMNKVYYINKPVKKK